MDVLFPIAASAVFLAWLGAIGWIYFTHRGNSDES